ncbi:MAG: type II secretion system protein [Phycisphaerales bacterium]|nr:type II secretion system protein [Phycisphaerales bacterium]
MSGRPARPGFSLVDVLVSIAVIGVLISLLIPSLGLVRETAHQVVCRSNIRQIGLALAMFADEHKDAVPTTVFVRNIQLTDRPSETVTLRMDPQLAGNDAGWDGLGKLYGGYYLPSGPVFYCPSHKGDIRFERFEFNWGDQPGRIVGNYQYRGGGPTAGSTNLTMFLNGITPSSCAIAADSIRNRPEFNHQVGANVLHADLSVSWFRDVGGQVISLLVNGEDPTPNENVNAAWRNFDGH